MSSQILVTQLSQEVSVPAWLDQQELERVARQEIPDFRKIESTRCKWEVQLSHPALCVQLQVLIGDNKKRLVRYLLKSPESVSSGLKLPIQGDFSVERYMYETVLPALEQLYKDVDKVIHFSPISYQLKQKSNCLYLDYVLAKGYSVGNTRKGLNVTAMEAVLSKLAAYHAATACYIERNSGKIRELPKLSGNRVGAVAELKSLLQMKFHESLRSNDAREYEDKVKSFQKYLNAHVGVLDVKNSFNVILNGSCWSNNLLNQVDAFGNVKDSLFSDFHAAKYGPVVYDLFSLLLTAPAEKTRRFDGYVKYYHDQLVSNLNLLKFRGRKPSLTDLQCDLLKYGHWGFEVATEVLPVVLSAFDTNEDIDELFRNPVFGEQVRELLPWLENRGYFEED
ncbi:uncharacterized protein [Drosophila kikkawai]|uniref:Uncharacterized protein isoform X1 n=1 Tax=Drosophila kikkawai TaxID=30033 RepID=A0ABM3C492_DROKI|nr:uncharacterized protein LOC108082804 isoform X1 [Drosophila kikkawai]